MPSTVSSTADSIPALDLEHLSFRYPPSSARAPQPPPALDDVTLTVKPGEIFGILGPNGSGKTTLFRLLATLLPLRPCGSGRAAIFNHDLEHQPTAVRRCLGVVFQSPSLDNQLSVAENLYHHGLLYGFHGSDLARRIQESLSAVDLLDRRNQAVAQLSGGMRRRVDIAKATLHQPRLLLLDEPSTGLDPSARQDLSRYLSLLRQRGVTMVLTTHLMDLAEDCDRLAVLSAGKLLALDAPDRLRSLVGGDILSIELSQTPPEAQSAAAAESLCREISTRFAPWPTGTEPRLLDGRIRMERPDGPRFLAQLASFLPPTVRTVTLGKPTLEDAFIHLTGKSFAIRNPDDPT
ncbi:MAG: ABC transporter ATP-binding protein [Phycisphaeraceae bacterium]|nr:ABC transporter ATP-binding protein [Phycisphaeraceae bacterium]